MAPSGERTHEWVMDLESLHSLEDMSPTGMDPADVELPRWSSEITPVDGEHPTRAADSRPTSASSEPLPGAAHRLDFVKTRRGGFRATPQTRLRNNLLAAVGFLELANAGDFAANVWNQTPVPRHALVLMVIGGVAALCMIFFAVRDGRLSCANVRALRQERRYLQAQRALHEDRRDANMLRTIDCFLDMNTRELGTEYVDRIGTDALLGFSSLLVGVGTLLATAGDRDGPTFRASNLLTGYVGNAPCVVFGCANVSWSSYVWVRAKKQQRAALRYVKGSTRIGQMLRNRTSSIQMHAGLHGATGLVAGAAAMISSTMWWGYVVLVPCVVTSGLVNLFWRRRVGYERPLVAYQITSIDQDTVLEALRYTDNCSQRVRQGRKQGKDAFSMLLPEAISVSVVLDFVRKNNLFEDFCLRLLHHDPKVSGRLHTGTSPRGNMATGERLTIDWRQFEEADDDAWKQRLLKVARDLINESALKSFIYQERHLLEVLGCYMCRGAEFGRKNRNKAVPRNSVQTSHQNVHSYAGRHANDWLFGGFSLRESIKGMLRL